MIGWVIGVAGFAGAFALYQHWKRNIWFFRDPKRKTPKDDNLVVSPCDGRVIYVKGIAGGKVTSEKIGAVIPVPEISKDPDHPKEGILIGIYMSPFDVHFNYAPIDGVARRIVHSQARLNLPMVDLLEYVKLVWLRKAVDKLGQKYHLENERNTIFIDGKCKLALVEIADKVVNKIDCYIKEGQGVSKGQKISFIKRGSQVDLVLWGKDFKILAQVGHHVTGAETPLVRIGA